MLLSYPTDEALASDVQEARPSLFESDGPLKEWVDLEPTDATTWSIIKGMRFRFSAIFNRCMITLKGPESVFVEMRMDKADKDEDGSVTAEEEEATVAELTTNCNTTFMNCGVVGALVLGVAYPLVMEVKTLSDSSKAYFGHKNTQTFAHIHHGILCVAVVLCMQVMVQSVLYFTQLNFYLPTASSKLWWIRFVKPQRMIASSIHVLGALIVAAPAGAAAFHSPRSAIITLSASVGYYVALLIFECSTTARTVAHVHNIAREHAHSIRGKAGAGGQMASNSAVAYVAEERQATVRAALEKAGLTLDAMSAVQDNVFCDSLLKDAGVQLPGDRLAIIRAVMGKDSPPRASR